MAGKKLLIVLCEGTAVLVGQYCRTVFSDYLQKLFRSICDDEDAIPDVQLTRMQFNVNHTCLIQRVGWVRPVDYYMKSLAAMEFIGGGYVKLWEGDLTCELNNQIVFLTTLQMYQKWTDFALLAQDWPSTMRIYDVITHKNMLKNEGRVEKVNCLAFVTINQHEILKTMQKYNVSAVIQLQSHVLILSASNLGIMWIGTLFPKVMVNLDLNHKHSCNKQYHHNSNQL